MKGTHFIFSMFTFFMSLENFYDNQGNTSILL